MIVRRDYMAKIIPLIDKNLIKVFTGVRRSGKTVLLGQIREYLLKRGAEEKQIAYLDLESRENAEFRNADNLYRHILDVAEKAGRKVYVFLDEIQSVPGWEETVASLLVDLDCDLYVSASDASLLSGELATLIAGRYVRIRVFPFTLSEAKDISVQNGSFVSDQDLFEDYLLHGGLPLRFSVDAGSAESCLSDTYDSIVMKDIVRRNRVGRPDLLDTLLRFLMDNVGDPFSARSIASALSAAGTGTAPETVSAYAGFIEGSMLAESVRRWDMKRRKLLTSDRKYYASDVGLRNVAKTGADTDRGRLYENVVFNELLSRGYAVTAGKTDDFEIDFICRRGTSGEKIYVQVCHALSSEETVRREFGNLRRIRDNYPKYVVSGDVPDFSRDGIRHVNIIDFLLKRQFPPDSGASAAGGLLPGVPQ